MINTDAIAVIQEQKAKKALEDAKPKENCNNNQGDVAKKVGTTDSIEAKSLDDKSKLSLQNVTSASTSSPSTVSTAKPSGQANNDGKPKMKPVSITAIPNTPWCVVWTDKGRVFYFNPTTNVSVWVRPVELRDREEVDKLVNTPPANLTVSSTSDSQQQPSTTSSSQASGKTTDLESQSSKLVSPQPEKKMKLDINISLGDSNSRIAQASTNIAPKVVKKEVASEIEKEAAKKRDTIPLEERIEIFSKMLEEKEVDYTSTFQRELSKIVFDPRYLLLTSSERRQIFDKFCSDKTEQQQKKRRELIKTVTNNFKALLSEADLNSRSNYEEFHEKYSKDPRYRAIEKTKDREIMFDDHLAHLRRKEREEKSQQNQQHNDVHHRRRSRERRSDSRHRSSSRSVPRDEIETIYQALLVELITDTDLDWHEAKRIMRKSSQWSYLDSLPRDWMEMVFERHLDKIYHRRKEKFQALLDETKEIKLGSEWRDVKRIIKDDPRYIKFSSSDRRCEREFRNFIQKRRAIAEENFRKLLRETTLIDKDTRRKIEESEHQHLIDVIGTLQNDERYVELEPISEDRRKILLGYIEELATNLTPTSSKSETVDSPVVKEGESSLEGELISAENDVGPTINGEHADIALEQQTTN